MTIQSELERIGNNISSAYSALGENGATIPETQNSDNLATTVQTLPEKQDKITASGLLKGDGAGNISAAVAGTDYLPMSGGTLSGQLQASSTAMAALAVQQVRNIYFGTAEMEDGVSDLPAGVLYFQYDAGV